MQHKFVTDTDAYNIRSAIIVQEIVAMCKEHSGTMFSNTYGGFFKDEDGKEKLIAFFEKYGVKKNITREYDKKSFDTSLSSNDTVVWFFGAIKSKNVNMVLYTYNQKMYEEFEGLFEDLIDKSPENNVVLVLSRGQTGYKFSAVGEIKDEIIRENYTDDIAEAYDKIIENLGSGGKRGRFTLLSGKPGTGKTYFLRGLISKAQKCTFLYVPSHLVSALADPEMITTFIEYANGFGDDLVCDCEECEEEKECMKSRSLVIIVEDADACLLTRQSDNLNVISSILNMTDGILGTALNFQIIATTNADNVGMDKALLRPGRLFLNSKFKLLTKDEAHKIYRRIVKDENAVCPGKFPCSLAEVYHRSFGNEPNDETENKKVGF